MRRDERGHEERESEESEDRDGGPTRRFIPEVGAWNVRSPETIGSDGGPAADNGPCGKWGCGDGRSHDGRSGEGPLSGNEIPFRDDRPLSKDLDGRCASTRFAGGNTVAETWS